MIAATYNQAPQQLARMKYALFRYKVVTQGVVQNITLYTSIAQGRDRTMDGPHPSELFDVMQ